MDLNADLGESFGRWTLGDDAALIRHITSANVACGFHAGDPVVMERTVRACREAGVAVGAQPGYPDLQGFGRRSLPLSPDDRYDAVLAWDVFDYMRIDQVKPLMARIVPRLRPHAQVLVLASMQSQIPAVPLRYRIVDRDHLDSEAPGREADHAVMRPCPRYRQSDLVHMMPTLTVRRCYLLRNGVKEYLLG